MGRYEYTDGKSNKFWDVALRGNLLITTYGRIGSQGQKTTKAFLDVAQAREASNKLVSEKLRRATSP